MKTFYLIPLCVGVFAAHSVAIASTQMTGADGTPYLFEDWSSPTVVQVDSIDGLTALVRRTCRVTRQHPRNTRQRTIEQLYYPEVRELLVGVPADRYAVIGGKIWAMTASDRLLRIRQSITAADASQNEEAIIDDFLHRLLVDIRVGFWNDDTVCDLDVERIFGTEVLWPWKSKSGKHIVDPWIVLSNVTVTAKGARVILYAPNTEITCRMSLDADLHISDVTRDNEVLPILCDRFPMPREINIWFPPVYLEVPSFQGKLSALGCARHYNSSSPVFNIRALVMIASRDVWFGPEDCELAACNGKILGFSVDADTRELRVFTGPRLRLPADPQSAGIFQAELRKYEEQYQANNYQFKPDWKVSIPSLLAGDARFATDETFYMFRIVPRENGVAVILSAEGSVAFPEIVVGPGPDVVSTTILASPGREIDRLGDGNP